MADDTTKDETVLGPFTNDEIQDVARKAVEGLGREWRDVKGSHRIGFVAETKEILSGKNVTPDFGELVPGATPAVQLQFKNLVLQEFRNSPKWDEAGFKAGYGAPAATADASITTGSEATQ